MSSVLESLDLRIPPLPQTLLHAFELANDPDGPDVKRVVRMVEQDPAAVARLMRVANSALYARSRRISDVQRAVVTLGPSSVIGIVMSFQLMDMKSELDDVTTLPFLNIVRHSIATAFLSRFFTQRDPNFPGSDSAQRERIGEAYTAGLMHDFGKVVLLYNFPEKASELYGDLPGDAPAEDGPSAIEQEQTSFGYTHAEVGSFLLSKLSFPDSLQQSINLHHADAAPGDEHPSVQYLVGVLQAANLAAHGLGYSLSNHEDWEACAAHPEWDNLAARTPLGYPDGQSLIDTTADARDELSAYVGTML